MADQSASAGSAGSVRYLNAETLSANPAFTQVVVASGPIKTIYVGMQCAVDGTGHIVGKGDIGAQTDQVLKNVGACLDAAGAKPEHLVTWTICLVQGQPIEPAFAAGLRWWGNRPNPPANTVMIVAALSHPDFLIGIEATAAVPLSKLPVARGERLVLTTDNWQLATHICTTAFSSTTRATRSTNRPMSNGFGTNSTPGMSTSW